MNASDKQRLKVLGGLLPVLAIALWIGSRIYTPVAGVGAEPDGVPGSVIDPAAFDAVEIPEWLELIPGDLEDGVERDPFRYAPAPASPRAAGPRALVAPPPVVRGPDPPPVPPPPPPIPFVYVGYGGTGENLAILLDEASGTNRYVSEQDVVLGRYRVNRVTDRFVEIEDLEQSRTERLPRVGVE